MMLGGVIGGYCANGRLKSATAPARVMTIDSTAAKIGRSMKKWESITAPQLQHRQASGACERPGERRPWRSHAPLAGVLKPSVNAFLCPRAALPFPYAAFP